jgi:hypothetical protein
MNGGFDRPVPISKWSPQIARSEHLLPAHVWKIRLRRRIRVSRRDSALTVSAQAETATTDDLGSAAFLVDLSSMKHETQYTRLFRS